MACSIAFKEWSAIVEALASGKQTILLRKGGIHEGRGGFQPEHDEFWLFPTYVHQQTTGLAHGAESLLDKALEDRPAEGVIHLQHLCRVADVVRLTDERQLPAVAPFHFWSEKTIHDRFHYKEPGLFLLIVRCFSLPAPHAIEDEPRFGGCRTWVDLGRGLPTSEAVKVLDDAAFQARCDKIRKRLT